MTAVNKTAASRTLRFLTRAPRMDVHFQTRILKENRTGGRSHAAHWLARRSNTPGGDVIPHTIVIVFYSKAR